MSLSDTIELFLQNHQTLSVLLADVLANNLRTSSELELRNKWQATLAKHTEFYPNGWYDPPPQGVGVLFSDYSNNFERSKFPTLRKEPFWPNETLWESESVGMMYVSPVHRATGLIGDLGLTFYQGNQPGIQNHLRNCLEATEAIADKAQIGMSFKELQVIGEEILDQHGLHNNFMVTYNDSTGGPDYGHTVPWTYETPSPQEQAVINNSNFEELKKLITQKRIYINPVETFVIPENIAFSIEPRLGSKKDPVLPGGYYYCIVTFRDGEKKVINNINPIFDALGINYMRSRF